MRILVSGSTGFLGTALVETLAGPRSFDRAARAARDIAEKRRERSQWKPLHGIRSPANSTRPAPRARTRWFISRERPSPDGRWNASRKNLLRTSRIDATRHLIGALAKLQRPPRVIVAASAIGYYGNRGDETLTEASAPGNDFLAGVCREWEAETARGVEFGARVVSLRFGIILAAHGGALPRMAMPFKLGAGGRLGDGRQWMSWLTLQETVSIIQFALAHSGLAGPVNTVAPNPVRNSEFTRVLAKTLHRPALFPAPAFALRLALGEMADALLLVSQKVVPSKLADSGYSFLQPSLAGALAEVFRK